MTAKWGEMVRQKFEGLLIRAAAYILMERNAVRAPVVSRSDNNAMWIMAEKLQAIAGRIENGYVEPPAAVELPAMRKHRTYEACPKCKGRYAACDHDNGVHHWHCTFCGKEWVEDASCCERCAQTR